MSYKPITLFRLLEDIDRHETLLPHIQRPFVWEDEQMIRLFDSLMRGYPIQTLLFWRTKDHIKARKFMQAIDRDAELSTLYDPYKSQEGVEKTFVLDGQQRLQTLYAIFAGGVSTPSGVTEAYCDVTAGGQEIDGGELMHRLIFARESPGASYYRIRNLRESDSQKDPASLGDDWNELLEQKIGKPENVQRERLVRRTFAQLSSLLREEKHFWIQTLDGVASEYSYRKVLDIFVRVNSGGTKLAASDLMFAAMKEGWEDIEENIENTVEMLNDGRFGFDTEFPLKAMLVSLGKGAETHHQKFSGASGEQLLHDLKAHWDRSEKAFQELHDFIRHDLRLSSDRVVLSYRAFVPIFDWLFHNPKPSPENRAAMRASFFKSQLFGWYSSSTDTVLNALHAILGHPSPNGFPMEQIKAYFRARGSACELAESHLSDKRLRTTLLELIYSERWGASPFDVRFKGNEPHVDHIYPQHMLRTKLAQSSLQINDIGNLRFLGATDNCRKRGELPASYFKRLKDAGVPIDRHLLVLEFYEQPNSLNFDEGTFATFRLKRRSEIFRIARGVVDPEVAI